MREFLETVIFAVFVFIFVTLALFTQYIHDSENSCTPIQVEHQQQQSN